MTVRRFSEALAWRSPPPTSRVMGVLFERDFGDTTNIAAGFVRIPAGEEQEALSIHPDGEEVYLVVRGRARFVLGEMVVDADPETAVYVAPGVPHRAINLGNDELLLYWVNSPPVFGARGAYRDLMSTWAPLEP